MSGVCLERRLLLTLLRQHIDPLEVTSMIETRSPPAIALLLPPSMDILIVPDFSHPHVLLLRVEIAIGSEEDDSDMEVLTRLLAVEELL